MVDVRPSVDLLDLVDAKELAVDTEKTIFISL